MKLTWSLSHWSEKVEDRPKAHHFEGLFQPESLWVLGNPSHCVAAPTFEDGKHGHTDGLSLRGRASEFLGHPNGPRTSSKHNQNPDQRWSISVQNASLAPPGYYCLGVFFHVFSTFRCIKRLWYPKIEGGSPRNPFRTTYARPPELRSRRKTSPKIRAQIRNRLKRGGDLAAAP